MTESSNRLIASLEDGVWRHWAPYFERIALSQREELFGPDDPLAYLWFPENGVCSQVVESGNGGSVEVAITGREGVVGLPAIFGAKHAATRAVAQMSMSVLRIRVDDFMRHLHADHPLLHSLERYAAITLSSLSQIAGCNRLHRTEQRLCRWLLMVRDRVGEDELPITHDFLALMMGTRRSSVTEVAQRLQQRGLIRYERGVISYTDVAGLKEAACECYGIIRRLYDPYLEHLC